MLDLDFLTKGAAQRQHLCYTYSEGPFRRQVITAVQADAANRGLLVRAADPTNPSSDAAEEGLFGEALVIVDWAASSAVLPAKALAAEQAALLKLTQGKHAPNRTLALWTKELAEACPDHPAHRKAAQPIDEPNPGRAADVGALYDYLRRTTPLFKAAAPTPDPCRDAFIAQGEHAARDPEPLRTLISLFDLLATLAHDDSGKYDPTAARQLLAGPDGGHQDRLTDLLADLATARDTRPATALSRAAEAWLADGNEQRAFVGLLYRGLHDLMTVNAAWGVDPKEAGYTSFQARRLERHRNLAPQPLLRLHLRLVAAEPVLNTVDNVMVALYDQATAHVSTNQS